MKQLFKQIPRPLQKQIFFRIVAAAVFLAIFVFLVVSTGEFFTAVPCIAMSILCVIMGLALFRKAVIGEYIVLYGECVEKIQTSIRKRTKAVILKTQDKLIRISAHQSLHRIALGARFEIYVAINAPVYEKNGYWLLNSCLAWTLANHQ